MSKSQILQRVQSAISKNHIPTYNPNFKDIFKYTHQDLLQEYKLNQTANKANVIDSSMANLSKDILKIFQDLKAKQILYTLDLPIDIPSLGDGFENIAYDKSIGQLRPILFKADTAIFKAVCGIANLGIIGTVSSPLSPRLASLITLNCVILLPKTSIVANLFEGTQMLKAQAKDGILPTNLLFIAGPSRTADIELKTVFGVHGPQNVTIILY